jgi:hypothetical protein
MEAKHWTQTALVANPAQPPSVAMNSDVRDIAARERAKLKDRAAQVSFNSFISITFVLATEEGHSWRRCRRPKSGHSG